MADAKKKKILVIDDNLGILFAIKEALEIENYLVVTSETFPGVDAIHALRPKLIYLDISLVGADGREICRELKADKRTAPIPVVILTAYPNARELAKEAGADDCLPKPFDLDTLWTLTKKLIS